MKRYYLSKIVQLEDPPGAYGHRLQAGYPGVEWEGDQIKVDPVTGVPTEKALLVLVGGIDHLQFQNDAELVPMPNVPLDLKVSAIQTQTKLTAKAAIVALGYTEQEVDDAWGNADGYRDVIDHYGKLNNAAFDSNNFDLDES